VICGPDRSGHLSLVGGCWTDLILRRIAKRCVSKDGRVRGSSLRVEDFPVRRAHVQAPSLARRFSP